MCVRQVLFVDYSATGGLQARSPLDVSLTSLSQPRAAPLALGPSGLSSAPQPVTSPNPASKPTWGQPPKPAQEPKQPKVTGTVEPFSCRGLPDIGTSKRQAFRCEIFGTSGLQVDLGYGRPVGRKHVKVLWTLRPAHAKR